MKAIGIELDFELFRRAVLNAEKYLNKKELDRAEFWCVPFEQFDFPDATVIYSGHTRTASEVKFLKEKLGEANVCIVTIDLPFIGYRPVASTTISDCTLFLMRYPLESHKMESSAQWAVSVLKKPDATIKDVYKYYDSLLSRRGFKKFERIKARRELGYVVSAAFY